MTIKDIYDFINGFAPFESAEPWDNSGLLIGDCGTEIRNVFVALDVTPAVVKKAQEIGAQMIVSHHPVIFHPLRHISADSVQAQLIRAGISVLSAHTNFDKAPGGVNDILCENLGLPFYKVPPETANGFLNVCNSETRFTADDFASFVGRMLNARVSFLDSDVLISKIAVCAGAGSDFLEEAAALGCDAYLTGEASHHDYLNAAEYGIALFTAGHYETEFPAVIALCGKLQAAFPAVRFVPETQAASFLTVV